MEVEYKEEPPNESEVLDETDALPKLNVDRLLRKSVYACGLWQFMVTFLAIIGTPSTPTYPVFANSIPLKRCYMGEEIEQVLATQKLNFDQAAAIVGPWNDDSVGHAQTMKGCTRYKVNWTDQSLVEWIRLMKLSNYTLTYTDELQPCPNGYVYQLNELQYSSSVVVDFNTVCESNWLVPMGTSVYMFGMMIGFIFGGWAGDYFGRKRSTIAMSVFEILGAIGTSLAPNYYVYILSRAVIGAANSGKITVLNVLMIELTLAEYRAYFSSLMSLGYNFILRALISLFAYYIPNWRWLNVAVMAPSLFFVVHIFLLPESPRWLLSKNRDLHALKSLQTGCYINSVCCQSKTNPAMINQLIQTFSKATPNPNRKIIQLERKPICKRIFGGITQCFSTKKLAIITTLGIMIFICQTMTFFGILLYARLIRANIYIVSCLNAATTLPALAICTLLYCTIRQRKRPLIGCYIAALISLIIGGSYALSGKVHGDIVLSITSNLALMCCTATVLMLFIYIPELYPSSMRSLGLGMVAGLGRIGAMICTFINELDYQFGHGLPLIIYAAALFLTVILLFLLPDTRGVNLED